MQSGRGCGKAKHEHGPVGKKLVLALAAILAMAWLLPSARGAEQQTLEIASKSGVHVFSVELATNDEERERGLMFRRSVPEGTGMLFDFKRDQDVSFWMREHLCVARHDLYSRRRPDLRIAENTMPESERLCAIGRPGAGGA